MHAMNAYRRSRGTTPLITSFDIRWRWVVNFASRPLCPRGDKAGTHWIGVWVIPSASLDFLEYRNICRRLGGEVHTQNGKDRFWKMLQNWLALHHFIRVHTWNCSELHIIRNTNLWLNFLINYPFDMFRPQFVASFRELVSLCSWYVNISDRSFIYLI